MILIKLTILAWVIFYVARALVFKTKSARERLYYIYTNKMTPGMWFVGIWYFACLLLTVISVIWLLFFFLT